MPMALKKIIGSFHLNLFEISCVSLVLIFIPELPPFPSSLTSIHALYSFLPGQLPQYIHSPSLLCCVQPAGRVMPFNSHLWHSGAQCFRNEILVSITIVLHSVTKQKNRSTAGERKLKQEVPGVSKSDSSESH